MGGVEDANEAKERGNTALKAQQFDEAIAAYDRQSEGEQLALLPRRPAAPLPPCPPVPLSGCVPVWLAVREFREMNACSRSLHV